MSNRIVSMQVSPPPAAPRGALVLGAFAAAVWTAARDLLRAFAGTPAPLPAAYRESRHA